MSGIFSKLSVCQQIFRGITGTRFLHKKPPVLSSDPLLQNTEGSKKPPVVTLGSDAILKHIYPRCRGRKHAEQISYAMSRKGIEVETLLMADVEDFHQDGNCMVSKKKVPYYHCTQTNGNVQVFFRILFRVICIFVSTNILFDTFSVSLDEN